MIGLIIHRGKILGVCSVTGGVGGGFNSVQVQLKTLWAGPLEQTWGGNGDVPGM